MQLIQMAMGHWVAKIIQAAAELEYKALFEKANLRLTRVVPTPSPVSVVEAVQA